MIRKYIIHSFIICTLGMCVFACSPAGGNKTGHEFMPDMVHNIGYEANYYDYYYYNRWGTELEYKQFALPRLPVKGTIARGFAGSPMAKDVGAPTTNGSVPYYYGDTEEERTRASLENIRNPYPITEKGLARGKKLFDITCAICHGINGDGLGYLARDGGKYPVAPANFQQDVFYTSSNGRYYHAIMYGKNMMGSYADKLSYEERYQVIHYIRSLQAKAKKLKYDKNENTFSSIDIPEAKMASQENDVDENSIHPMEKKMIIPSIHKETKPKH
ncbi:MAG: c-type cytochrome [Saprospiraceae bacterium]